MVPVATTTAPVRSLCRQTQSWMRSSVDVGTTAVRGDSGGGRWGRIESGIHGEAASCARITPAIFSTWSSMYSATSPEYLRISLGIEESYKQAWVSKGAPASWDAPDGAYQVEELLVVGRHGLRGTSKPETM